MTRLVFYSTFLLLSLLSVGLQAQSYRINTIAGNINSGEGGPASAALLRQPLSVLADDRGGFFVYEFDRFRIVYVNDQGRISSVAGLGYFGPATDGISASLSSFGTIYGMRLSPSGELFFADHSFCRISRIDRAGVVRHVVGTGTCGFNGDGQPALGTNINAPFDIAFDRQGLLVFSDSLNNRVRRVTAAGIVETVAGNGATTFSQNNVPALTSTLAFPHGLAISPDGAIYVAESGYRRVRQITTGGVVVTVAGDGFEGNTGDGLQASVARFGLVSNIALDSTNNRLFVGDFRANRVRVVNLASGVVSAFAGAAGANNTFALAGFSGDGGPANAARFNAISAFSIALDRSGNLLITDQLNDRIRRVDNSTNIISTIAGRTANVASGVSAVAADLRYPRLIPGLPGGDSLIVDPGNKVLRRLSPNGTITTIAGVPYSTTSAGDSGPAQSATFSSVLGAAIDASGRIGVSDNRRLRIIDGATISASSFELPPTTTKVLYDSPRNRLFALQPSSHRIQVTDLTLPQASWINFAGNGTAGYSGDNAAAANATLRNPGDMALDAAGNLYISDNSNSVVRRVNPAGIISTIAGTGAAPTSGSPLEGVALQVPIRPRSVAVNPSGTLLSIAEPSIWGLIRQVQLNTGQIRRIAGRDSAVISNIYTGDGGLATAALLRFPSDLSADASGNVFFTEALDDTIRILTPFVVTSAEIVSGDNQSAAVSTRLANPLVLRVLNGPVPVDSVRVSFTATGGATVSPAQATTGANGQVSVSVTLGASAGPVTITAQIDGLTTPITFRATATSGATGNPNAPAIRAPGGVVTAGAFGANPTISSGSWIEIYGSNFSTTTRSWADADFRGPLAPTELDGVRVSINNRPAFVAFISPGQINAQVPDGIAAGPATITVTNSNGVSESVSVTAAAASPGILAPSAFLINGVQYAAALHQDGAFVGAPGLIAGANFRPARAGDTVTLYGVGFGATNPVQSSGQVVSSLTSLANLAVRMGEADATIQFAGLAPNAIGLFQFNLVVPPGLRGNFPVSFTLNGVRLQQALTLTASE